MDRLLGSRALQRECASVYAAMARHWLRGNDTPLIVVDWSDLNADRSAQMIRASVALEGRSLTLYTHNGVRHDSLIAPRLHVRVKSVSESVLALEAPRRSK
jgi:hypothetical protein